MKMRKTRVLLKTIVLVCVLVVHGPVEFEENYDLDPDEETEEELVGRYRYEGVGHVALVDHRLIISDQTTGRPVYVCFLDPSYSRTRGKYFLAHDEPLAISAIVWRGEDRTCEMVTFKRVKTP